MENSLLVYLLINISLLLLVATILTEIQPLRTILKSQERTLSNQISLGLIFGLLSISCTYTGLNFQGAVVNTRVISTVAAGLVGGAVSGIFAGLLSGAHRYLFDPCGFTSLACGLGTICFGLIGSLAYHWFQRQKRRNLALIGLVLLAELVQCVLILLLCKPFAAAVALEMAILLPKMITNSLGLVMFMSLLDRLNRNLTIELVEQQNLALFIAQACLPYLREGMGNRQALQKTTETVRATLPEFQVVITDREQVLAASGIELSQDALPAPARQAIEEEALVVVHGYRDEDNSLLSPNQASIAAPLTWDGQVVGILMLVVPMGPNLILEADIRTAEGLAQLFSTMLELSELQHQVELRQQAEFRALQSQINPHFLFNALNTISALCTTNPDRAKENILTLANYFRQTLSINEEFVTLKQELSNVDNYLALTKARFEDAIHVSWELPEDLTALQLPPLILQPIVENAIRHGGTTPDNRYVRIQITQDSHRAYIQVSDHGHGFPPQVLEKLRDPADPSYSGLFNVRKRLRSIYGNQCIFQVNSTEHGSTVAFSIPLVMPDRAAASPVGSDTICVSR